MRCRLHRLTTLFHAQACCQGRPCRREAISTLYSIKAQGVVHSALSWYNCFVASSHKKSYSKKALFSLLKRGLFFFLLLPPFKGGGNLRAGSAQKRCRATRPPLPFSFCDKTAGRKYHESTPRRRGGRAEGNNAPIYIAVSRCHMNSFTVQMPDGHCSYVSVCHLTARGNLQAGRGHGVTDLDRLPRAGWVICLNSRKPQDQPIRCTYLRRLAPISARKARSFS